MWLSSRWLQIHCLIFKNKKTHIQYGGRHLEKCPIFRKIEVLAFADYINPSSDFQMFFLISNFFPRRQLPLAKFRDTNENVAVVVFILFNFCFILNFSYLFLYFKKISFLNLSLSVIEESDKLAVSNVITWIEMKKSELIFMKSKAQRASENGPHA